MVDDDKQAAQPAARADREHSIAAPPPTSVEVPADIGQVVAAAQANCTPVNHISDAGKMAGLAGPLSEGERLLEAASTTGDWDEQLTRLQAEARRECERLRKIVGLRANPKIAEAVEQHITEAYKTIKPDSCFSQVHRVYETGDALLGPSVVVDWHNRTVWFSLDGDSVEVQEFPKKDAEAALAAVRGLLQAWRDEYAECPDDMTLYDCANELDRTLNPEANNVRPQA